MVTTFVKAEEQTGGRPLFLKIHGQVYHGIGGLYPQLDQNPVYNQIYIYDVEEARLYSNARETLLTVAVLLVNCMNSTPI